MRRYGIAMIGATFIVGLVAGGLRGIDHAPPGGRPGIAAHLQSGPTLTPPIYYGDPILTAGEAISKTLSRFPEGHAPHSEEARLVSVSTLYNDWFEGRVESDDVDMGWPVWLVGVLGDELTLSDTIDFPTRGTGVITDTTPVDGMFYAWEANTGWPFASGGLISTTHTSYETLVQLDNEEIPITQPTQEPPPGYP